MGMSGKDYDRAYPDYTPNKDKRMAEWRAKKAAERKKSDEERRKGLAERASEDTRKQAEKEERRELSGTVQPTPISTEPSTIPEKQPAGGVLKRPRRTRRQHFDTGHQPTLFDGVE